MILYYFSAVWCAPCKVMSLNVNKFMADNPNLNITLQKVDVDEQPELAEQFDVRSVPTLVLTDEVERVRILGATSYRVLESKIQEVL